MDTKNSMHLVLRSSLARGAWSFRSGKNSKIIREIIERFAAKYGVKVLSLANVGNHLHMQIKISNRFAYRMFIKAVTGAIAMKITNINRWTKQERPVGKSTGKGKIGSANASVLNELQLSSLKRQKLKFWDLRPFTRVIIGWRAILNLRDYIRINEMEGWGCNRREARNMLDIEKWLMSTA